MADKVYLTPTPGSMGHRRGEEDPRSAPAQRVILLSEQKIGATARTWNNIGLCGSKRWGFADAIHAFSIMIFYLLSVLHLCQYT